MPTFIPRPGDLHEIDARDLSDHPLLATVPMLAADSAEFSALKESIRDHGLDYRVLVDTEFRVVDGRNRRNALVTLGQRIPVKIVAAADAASIVVSSLVNRRHLTKGALAYLTAPLFDGVLAESKARRLANLRAGGEARGPQSPETPLSGVSAKTAAELAAQMGVSGTLFEDAVALHKAFAKAGPEVRAKYEPRVLGEWQDEGGEWREPIGLGRMLAGIGALGSNASTAEALAQRNQHDRLFFSYLPKLGNQWEQANPEQRAAITAELQKSLLTWPADLVATMRTAAAKAASELQKAAVGTGASA